MQLEKKGLYGFNTKYAPFAFEEISSESLSEAKNVQDGPVLKIYSPKDQDSLFTVAMEPENGEVHNFGILLYMHAIIFT